MLVSFSLIALIAAVNAACKFGKAEFTLSTDSARYVEDKGYAETTFDLADVVAGASLKVVWLDDPTDEPRDITQRIVLEVASGPEDLELELTTGATSTDVKVVAKTENSQVVPVPTTVAGGATTGGDITTVTGVTAPASSLLRSSIVGAVASCLFSSFAAADECFVELTLFVPAMFSGAVRFVNHDQLSSIVCMSNDGVTIRPIAGIEQELGGMALNAEGKCDAFMTYKRTASFSTEEECKKVPEKVVVVVPNLVDTDSLVYNGMTPSDEDFSYRDDALYRTFTLTVDGTAMAFEVRNGDGPDVQLAVQVDVAGKKCGVVYTCVAGLCLRDQTPDEAFCAEWTSTKATLEPPATVVPCVADDKELKNACAQECGGCSDLVESCCGTASSPVVKCRDSEYYDGCFNTGPECATVKCLKSCDYKKNCATETLPCGGDKEHFSCFEQCNCPYRQSGDAFGCPDRASVASDASNVFLSLSTLVPLVVAAQF